MVWALASLAFASRRNSAHAHFLRVHSETQLAPSENITESITIPDDFVARATRAILLARKIANG
jgi:hypothetical protein